MNNNISLYAKPLLSKSLEIGKKYFYRNNLGKLQPAHPRGC